MEDNGQEKYGLMDVRDNLWLGDDAGPRVYEDETLARAAATILTEQLGRWIQAMPFEEAGAKRDEVIVRMSTEEAIRNIDRGRSR